MRRAASISIVRTIGIVTFLQYGQTMNHHMVTDCNPGRLHLTGPHARETGVLAVQSGETIAI